MFLNNHVLKRLKKMVIDLVSANMGLEKENFEKVFSREMGKTGKGNQCEVADFLIKVECCLVEVEAVSLNYYRHNITDYIVRQINEKMLADDSVLIRRKVSALLRDKVFRKRKEEAVKEAIGMNQQRHGDSLGLFMDKMWRENRLSSTEPGVGGSYFPPAY